MTREEAIDLLSLYSIDELGEAKLDTWYKGIDEHMREALSMAIEALEMQDLCAEMLESAKPVSCSEKPNDLISRQDAIDSWDKLSKRGRTEFDQVLMTLPSAETQPITCDGCKHVGTYDTDFPCSGCIRREKDYYEPEE